MLGKRSERKILNNTILRDLGDRLVLTYHGNEIAGWTPDGMAQFTTTGWATTTTHDRLNAMIPAGARFFTMDYVGYVSDGERTLASDGAMLTVLPTGEAHAA